MDRLSYIITHLYFFFSHIESILPFCSLSFSFSSSHSYSPSSANKGKQEWWTLKEEYVACVVMWVSSISSFIAASALIAFNTRMYLHICISIYHMCILTTYMCNIITIIMHSSNV